MAAEAKASRQAELDALRAEVPAEWLESVVPHLVRLTIARSRVKRVTAVVHLTERYPEDTATAQLSSPTLPEPLLRKLEAACEREAAAHAGKPHLLPVVRVIRRALEGNRFVACAEEVAKAKALVCTVPKGLSEVEAARFRERNWVRLQEKAGSLTLRAQEGSYWLEATVSVPDQYPDEAPAVAVTGTNFDDRLRAVCANNAAEIARRMQEGFPSHAALAHQGPPPDKAKAASNGPAPDLSARGLKQLQHDREFLHSMAQVRGYDDRKVRRHIEHAELKTMRATGEAASAGLEVEAGGATAEPGRAPLPSLLTIVTYIVENTVRLLPRQRCPICGDTVLPATPEEQGAVLSEQGRAPSGAGKAARSIERLYCGHWYHTACLEKLLSEPPFGGDCGFPGCGRRIYHPRLSEQTAKLEKRWAQEQAKRREIDELAGLMGME